jgi:hypothetical protein
MIAVAVAAAVVEVEEAERERERAERQWAALAVRAEAILGEVATLAHAIDEAMARLANIIGLMESARQRAQRRR